MHNRNHEKLGNNSNIDHKSNIENSIRHAYMTISLRSLGPPQFTDPTKAMRVQKIKREQKEKKKNKK